MPHARQQIFGHVAQLLNPHADKIEVQTPFEAVERHYNSHISIEFDTDVLNRERTTMDSEAFDLSMQVVLTVKGTALESAGPVADDIAMLVQMSLATLDGKGTHLVTGKTVEIDIESVELDDSIQLETSLIKMYMNYEVFYRISPGNPALLV